jgi:serine/threonine protein kinase/WD40 repeat protein
MKPAAQQVESILAAAVEMESDAERRAFVDRACAGDVELKRRVEELIENHFRAGSFLESPAPGLAAPAGESVRERPGTVIGPYKLLEQIGEGGFGIVFMAEQTQPVRRKVALKVLKPGMDTRQVVARFEAERQALALMEHPNIALVFDGGETPAGRPYFVMELVRGVPITHFCDHKCLGVRERLALFIAVCEAVQHAHQKGIIHRDLKPSNVLVTLHDDKAVVKVIDFGIAKAAGQQLTEKTLFTNFAQMVGTPLYMSPEQAQLSGLDVDTRTDVYALGVLLYELLTGTTPFDKERLRTAPYDEIRRIIREEEPPPPSTRMCTPGGATVALSASRGSDPKRLSQLFRGELDWIVMKALDKDRTRRYESASALAADGRRYLGDEPVQACPPSAAYRLRKFVRRHRGPVVAASVVGLALVGGIVGTTWGLIRATGAEAEAVNEGKQKERALQDAKDRLFEALWRQGQAHRFSRQPGQRVDSLAALAEAAGIRPDGRLRDEAIAALALADVRRVPGWHAPPPGAAVAYGGQYRLYARADAPGGISVRSIPDDREVRRIPSGPIAGNSLAFSPDERFLLGLGDEDTLHVWRVADGQPALRDEPRDCQGHAFSPDGRLLAVGRQKEVVCFNLASGQEVRRWRLPAPAHTLAFHPENGTLAVGYSWARAVSVYDAASGALVYDVPVGVFRPQVVVWHPDGVRLAVAGGENAYIEIWDVRIPGFGRKQVTLEGDVQQVTALTFHPGGELLASHGRDGQLLVWHPSSGRLLMRLTSVSDPQFSPDGRWLGVAWEGDRADLLEVTPCQEYRTLVRRYAVGLDTYGDGDISPDGLVLVVGMGQGATLWALDSGLQVAWSTSGGPTAFFEGKRGEEGSPHAGPPVSLLTCGVFGLWRRRITTYDPGGNQVRWGPPQHLSPLKRAWFARAPDGRTWAAVTEEGGANQILDLETGAVRRELPPHPPDGEVRALSGDGRWAASCGWHSDRVRLWNVGTGEMAHEWAVGKQADVFFTPDSRALVIAGGDEFSFWDVQTFERIRQLRRDVTQYPGWVAFSPDGKLMALEMAPGVLHLMETATGRTVARLEDPHGDRATWQAFTPDGTRLVVVARYANAIHVWDLRAIRARLKEMNLDWDWPEFPPAPAGNDRKEG